VAVLACATSAAAQLVPDGSGGGVQDPGGGNGPTIFGPGPGGQYIPPPDINTPPVTPPPGGSGGGPNGPKTAAETRRGVVSGHSGAGLSGSTGARIRGVARGAETNLSVGGDRWDAWWETNKFDFIELRRVEDPQRVATGAQSESAAQRELRLAGIRSMVRDNVLPVLRDLTGSKDAAVRAAAIVALAKLRDQESIELATRLLSDPNYNVRRASMLALGVLTSGRSSWLLMNIADDSQKGRTLLSTSPVSVGDRGTALLAATLRGDQAASQVLVPMLTDGADLHPELLALACDAAGLMGSAQAVRPLVDIAFDRDLPQYVRSAAGSALGRIGDPSATPALMELLGLDLEPRRAAALALGEVAHPGATRVIERLADVLEDDNDAVTRHFAAVSLGRIGGPLAREALSKALDRAKGDMRPWLALGLGLCERGTYQGGVAELLLEHAEDESNTDSLGAYLVALGLTRSETALPFLIEHLRGGRAEVAGYAAMGLGLSGHPSAVLPLREALAASTNPDVLRQAALGLGVLGNSSAVPVLIDLMRTTKNPFVASYAAIGVAFLGDADAAGPLLDLIRRSGSTGLSSMYSAVALGQLFDTDRRPALSRLAAGDNYLARTSPVYEFLALGF
jgi:HEAT repeat protein